jgi:23S rRNA (cytidine1920-2'-O)/16S rRNA (cytidine1409-2'-O)-methyltransferase
MKQRLDQAVVGRGLTGSRSQAESYIRLGKVTVNNKVVTKPGALVSDTDEVELKMQEQYVSRAGLKLASVADLFKLDFRDQTVLDVGSSTGGFTDYALRHSAAKVIAVDVGTDQLHPSLRSDERIELYEKTDIRNFDTTTNIDIVLADVSFISLREILPSVINVCDKRTRLVIMVKPQFEARQSSVKHKGVIKNDAMRRQILKDFEDWAKGSFVILDKADSDVAGTKGNRERFYLLQKVS